MTFRTLAATLRRELLPRHFTIFSGDISRSLAATIVADIDFVRSTSTPAVGLETRSNDSCLPERERADRCHGPLAATFTFSGEFSICRR